MTAWIRRGISIVFGLALIGLATACGGATRTPEDPGAAAGQAPDLGSCDVTVTGSPALTVTSSGDLSSVATDYWLSYADTRGILESTAQDEDPDARPPDSRLYVESGMLANPRVIALGVACRDAQASVALVPGALSRYEHVPFRPNTYEIAPVSAVADAAMGTFVALVEIVKDGESIPYVVYQPGTLTIAEFDAAHIAGTFEFKAGSPSRERIEAKGHFNYRRPDVR